MRIDQMDEGRLMAACKAAETAIGVDGSLKLESDDPNRIGVFLLLIGPVGTDHNASMTIANNTFEEELLVALERACDDLRAEISGKPSRSVHRA